MNATCDLLTITIAPETAFDAHPSCAIARAAADGQLEKLKSRLLRQALNEVSKVGAEGFIRRAANEAAALAWETHFPLLVFPTLFEEKAGDALAQMHLQISVRRRSTRLISTCRRTSRLIQMRHDWSDTSR